MMQDVKATSSTKTVYVMCSGAGIWRMWLVREHGFDTELALSRNQQYLFFLPPDGLLFLSDLPLFLQKANTAFNTKHLSANTSKACSKPCCCLCVMTSGSEKKFW